MIFDVRIPFVYSIPLRLGTSILYARKAGAIFKHKRADTRDTVRDKDIRYILIILHFFTKVNTYIGILHSFARHGDLFTALRNSAEKCPLWI